MTVARENLDALTGLRFVAAFTVVLGHSYRPLLEVSGIGMPLFFTLSGFIIHYVYADAFATGGWRRAAGEFAVARFSRLYPLYFLLLIWSLLRGPMGPPLVTTDGVPVLLAYFLCAWTWWPFMVEGHLLTTWYYHISWSVSSEIFFYVFYALIIYRLSRITNFRKCLAILVLFCVISYLTLYLIFYTRDWWEPALLQHFPQFKARNDDFAESLYRWILYISPYPRLFEFTGGVLTCQLYQLARAQPALCARIRSGWLAGLALALIVVLFAMFRYLGEYEPWLAVGNHSWRAFLVNLHMNFLFAPACYLLIFSLALGGGAVGRALSSRQACFLGDISYSTYLSHPMAERILMHTGLVVTATALHLLAVLAIIYLMSWVLYSIVEVPAKRWVRQLLTPRPLPVASSASGN